jgi:hypothetical protein
MTRITLSLVTLASAVLVAGCGGSSSSSPGVAHLSSGAPSSSGASGGGSSSSSEGGAPAGGSSSSTEGGVPNQQKLVAYSQCMRSHGVPEFPEPTEGHLLIHSSNRNGHATGVNPQSSQFQKAQKDCAKLAPNGGRPPSPAQQAKAQEQALKFSACMRSHGVPNFPDPEFSQGGGAIRIRIGSKTGGPSGIDPNSPKFQDAQKACQSIGLGPKRGPGPAQAVPAP